MAKDTFTKQERLTGKKAIDRLFLSGKSFFYYPFRIAYVLEKREVDYPCRVLINVPKRLHKTAVGRNLLKRRIKEAYRLTKNDFYEDLGNHRIQMAILYSAKEVNDYNTIATKLAGAQKLLLKKLSDEDKASLETK